MAAGLELVSWEVRTHVSEHKPACVWVNFKLILQAAHETSPPHNISLTATGLEKIQRTMCT